VNLYLQVHWRILWVVSGGRCHNRSRLTLGLNEASIEFNLGCFVELVVLNRTHRFMSGSVGPWLDKGEVSIITFHCGVLPPELISRVGSQDGEGLFPSS